MIGDPAGARRPGSRLPGMSPFGQARAWSAQIAPADPAGAYRLRSVGLVRACRASRPISLLPARLVPVGPARARRAGPYRARRPGSRPPARLVHIAPSGPAGASRPDRCLRTTGSGQDMGKAGDETAHLVITTWNSAPPFIRPPFSPK